MAGATPVVDADQVPESKGLLHLLHEYLGPHLGGRAALQAAYRFRFGSSQGSQADGSRLGVEQADKEQHQHAADYSRYPEGCPQPRFSTAEQVDNQDYDGHRHQGPQALGGLQHAHTHTKATVEPLGYGGGQGHLEDAHGRAEDNSEVQVEEPDVGDRGGEHHAHDEQGRAHQHGNPHSEPVAQPAGGRSEHTRHHPLEGKGAAHHAVAPAKGFHQAGYEDAG